MQRHGRRAKCIDAAEQPEGAAVHCGGVAMQRRRRSRGVDLCNMAVSPRYRSSNILPPLNHVHNLKGDAPAYLT